MSLTDQEWQDLNRRNFTNHPALAGGWKPGQCPITVKHFERYCSAHKQWDPHEIPPPDLREDSTFVRVLAWTLKRWRVKFVGNSVGVYCVLDPDFGPIYQGKGDTPHEALARALSQMEPVT